MKIEGFGNFIQNAVNPSANKSGGTEKFGNTLAEMLESVNQQQINSEKAIESFVAGDGIEIHEVMVAGEQAKTSLQLLMEIRNKTMDMYKELTKMPL